MREIVYLLVLHDWIGHDVVGDGGYGRFIKKFIEYFILELTFRTTIKGLEGNK